MEITLSTFLIVCPLLFLSGLLDAASGGGGLISLPAYMIAGLPPHAAIATNKLSAVCANSLAAGRFFKNGLINLKLALPSVIASIIGSAIGTYFSMLVSEKVITMVTIAILPICAFLVLNKNLFNDNGSDVIHLSPRLYLVCTTAAFGVGMFDGFYGPGSATFMMIAFTVFAQISVKNANAQAKIISVASGITSLLIFLVNGEVVLSVGIAAAISSMLGSYVGAGLVMKNGSRIVKPCILLVLVLLACKLLGLF